MSCVFRHAAIRWIAVLLGALGLIVGLMSAPASAATRAKKPPISYFGMHYSGAATGSWPAAPIGSIRLWDAGTSWRHIQPQRGIWDWTALDAAVANAEAHGASINLVLGQTPQWAATFPERIGIYGAGAPSPVANPDDWADYVGAVANRYKGRVGVYEVWNEFELGIFWQGTLLQMKELAKSAYSIIKKADPGAVITSPSITLRSGRSRGKLYEYAKLGGLRYADVISVHAYPEPNENPERAMQILKYVRRGLADRGIQKPIWNTEVNYGLPWGGTGLREPIKPALQAAFVMRTYLLNWSYGVRRVYWYSWSAAPFMGVQMTTSDGLTVAGPGRAFVTVQRWMRGRVSPCRKNAAGTYRCDIQYRSGRGTVYWNPSKRVTVKAPAFASTRITMLGTGTRVTSGSNIKVGRYPILLRTGS